MPSPEPQAPAVEQKPASPPAKEEKTELNGYARSCCVAARLVAHSDHIIPTPALAVAINTCQCRHTAPSKTDEDAAPKVNGSAAKPDRDGPNGVGTPDAEKQSKPSADPKPAPTDEPKSPAKSEDPPTSAVTEERKARETEGEAKDGDVKMADAGPQPAAAATAKGTTDKSEQPEDASATKPVESKSPERQTNATAAEQEKATPSKDGKSTNPSTPAPPGPSTQPSTQDSGSGPTGMSQLAIDEERQPKSPAVAAARADVTMEDAPPSAKVARVREDDAAEEPSAKRAKTEPREDEVQVSTVPNDTKTRNGLDGIENWNNSDLEAKPITSYRVKEFRRIIGGIKKTKNGAGFKDAVAKLWPVLADAYLARTPEPIDLSELERGLRDHQYATLGDFKEKLSLLYKNSAAFNGEAHDVTRAALNVVENVWTKCLSVPDEEPVKKKTKQIPQRHHEQRAHARPTGTPPATDRHVAKPKPANRKPSSNAASPTGNGDAQTFAVPPGGVPQIRRASTNHEGDRPKRAIHPPRSKDIDYSSKPTTRRKDPEIQFCAEVLRVLMDPKQFNVNSAFLAPVDPVALGIPTYFSVIKKPMDLSTIESKMNKGEYTLAKQFQSDMELMLNNCFKFNGPGTPVHDQGKSLKSFFQSEWAKKDQWIAKRAASKPASIDSDGSDDESDGEIDVNAAGGNASMVLNTIAALQEKLQEETLKLNSLYMEDHPNEALIKLQSTVLSTVQQSLLTEKQKLSSFKPEKGAKAKGGKPPAKAKAGGGGGVKRAGGAMPAKKGGAAKKAPKKERSYGAAERNQIAQALSDGTFPNIDQAITIIKRDTGQLVSTDVASRIAVSCLLLTYRTGERLGRTRARHGAAQRRSDPETVGAL